MNQAWRDSDSDWRGGRRPYDLAKEVTVSGLIVAVVVVVLSVVFASPDPPALTFREWATAAPLDFAQTTLAEIDQTSLSATYGPPYQTTAQNGSTQGFGPLSPEQWFGQAIPINTWSDFVKTPLRSLGEPEVDAAIAAWEAADATTQAAWAKAYGKALEKAKVTDAGLSVPTAGDVGPLDRLVQAQVRMARTGSLDPALLYSNQRSPEGYPVWFSNDQTRALLYFGDSGQGGGASSCISPGQPVPTPDTCYYYNQSVGNTAPRYGGYLAGDTWGVINEVGNWPGAWWLFPYSFWYQWGPGTSIQSADLYAMIATGAVALVLLFLPFIPGLRSIPRLTRVYRVMWGDYYRLVERERRRDQE